MEVKEYVAGAEVRSRNRLLEVLLLLFVAVLFGVAVVVAAVAIAVA